MEVLFTSQYVIYDSELYHHGIKGQKWGIRRFQKKDGSLTPAGKKRYYDTPELQSQREEMGAAKSVYKDSKKAYSKAMNRYNSVPTPKNWERAEAAGLKYLDDKRTYNTAKLRYETNKETARIRENGIQFKNKSKHRLKLEESYKKIGMTDDQAQAAANKRIQTEKILAASAAMTVAACATYIAVKNRRSKIDGIIKAGEALQRIEMRDTNGKLNDVFYAAKGKHDIKRYEGMLGASRKRSAGHAYLMKLQAATDIKVASKDRAAKTFGDLYKNDPDFRKSVKDHVSVHFGGRNPIRDLNNTSDRNIKKMYENFNSNIPLIRNAGSGADTKFYDKLKSAGYGAIQDINDMKYSGYNAKNPLIVFDNTRNNIMVKSVSEMTGNLNKRGTIELAKATGEGIAKDFIKKAGPLSAAGLTAATVVTYRNDPKDEYANRERVSW